MATKAKLRPRHDGFTPARQKKFLKTLAETGCVRDACRVAGITSTTAYRWRKGLAGFKERWETALSMASVELEAVAWKRAVEGVEVVTVRNGAVVSTVKKPSDSILRLLMQGANPDKYGRTGGRAGPGADPDDEAEAAEEAAAAEAEAAERAAASREIQRRLGLFRDHMMRTNDFDPAGMSVAHFWVALQVAQAAFEARFGEPGFDFVYRPGCEPGSADHAAWRALAARVEARRAENGDDWDWGLGPERVDWMAQIEA